jgi:hypothetical protein
MSLSLFLYAAMVAWSPLGAHIYYEKPEATEARYHRFADEVVAAVEEDEPLFAGPDGRAKTALYLTSIASFETGGFVARVIDCRVGGDGSRSWGPFQSQTEKETACGSVAGAVHVALAQIRTSFKMCAALPEEDRLAAYASGSCDKGLRESRNRSRRARWWWDHHPFAP